MAEGRGVVDEVGDCVQLLLRGLVFDDAHAKRGDVDRLVPGGMEVYEMKEKLLKQKIDELKRIFEKENLDNLQSLKFDILEEKLDDGEEIVDTRGTNGGLVE